MKVTTVGNQILEFNITLPSNANTSIAPTSAISVTQRWGVVNGTTQITKFNIVHTTQYTDCSGGRRKNNPGICGRGTIGNIKFIFWDENIVKNI